MNELEAKTLNLHDLWLIKVRFTSARLKFLEDTCAAVPLGILGRV